MFLQISVYHPTRERLKTILSILLFGRQSATRRALSQNELAQRAGALDWCFTIRRSQMNRFVGQIVGGLYHANSPAAGSHQNRVSYRCMAF